ncbi:MAG: ORF6N domain-containing protein [Candidatus Omnitrophota bacterium]
MAKEVIPDDVIRQKIFIIRGQKVMLDKDLAELYGVATRDLNKAVNRNLERFPDDFMLTLTRKDITNLKFHFGTSSWGGTRKKSRSTGSGFGMSSEVRVLCRLRI